MNEEEYHFLYVNAMVGINGTSAFECWRIEPPMDYQEPSTGIGSRYLQSLGEASESTLVFFTKKSRTDSGLHHAPAGQWLFILKGMGLITLPSTNETLTLEPGSVLIAMDTPNVSEVGHYTEWTPGSIAVQQPFKYETPYHKIVHGGLCTEDELDVERPSGRNGTLAAECVLA
ncbi:hypothetical protein M422DRAFT_221318 [Sphaerobolus stellatus SS14]|nr:hypothetical protein M422DRAFT_221318 [Sphaerobolus stellatus SS14]